MISVIIPVYNLGAYVAQCLESIAVQTFKQFEIIVIDDGSTDSSYSVCMSFKHANPVINMKIVRKQNEGVSAARLNGVRLSKGEWVTFLDGDDTLPPDALAYLASSIQSNVGVVLGAYHKKYHDGQVEFCPNKSLGRFSATEYVKMNLKGTCEGAPWGKLFKREILTDYIFDLPQEVRTREDVIMNLRVAIHNQEDVIFIKNAVYNYTWLRVDSAVSVFLKKFNFKYELKTVNYQVSSLAENLLLEKFKIDVASLYMRYLWSWKKHLFFLDKEDFKEVIKIQKYILFNNKAHWLKLLKTFIFLGMGRMVGPLVKSVLSLEK